AGAVLRRLQRPQQFAARRAAADRLAHLVAAVPVDDHDASRRQAARAVDHVLEQRLARQRMQYLRQIGTHPLALACGKDDDVHDGSESARARAIAAGAYRGGRAGRGKLSMAAVAGTRRKPAVDRLESECFRPPNGVSALAGRLLQPRTQVAAVAAPPSLLRRGSGPSRLPTNMPIALANRPTSCGSPG